MVSVHSRLRKQNITDLGHSMNSKSPRNKVSLDISGGEPRSMQPKNVD